MRTIPLFLVLAVLFSCGKKEWSKKYIYDDCMKEAKKDKETSSLFTAAQLDQICDCSAEKAYRKYKSESEANNDEAGMMDIGADCARDVLSK
ncbi:MAG: hypothetical protein RJA57_722 [Bacteroidota bacterium]|jgi:hypothetical protein